jgi:hypothetical protein
MSARYVRSLDPERYGMAQAQMNGEILLPGAQSFLDARQHQFTSQLRKVSGLCQGGKLSGFGRSTTSR